ncbi:unnamed protein product [Hymenolepis diminuta]|uniref:Uncharacterized protein n=1 Tax=Hymenolepis diminuta TaxID=6216 RepID=A0A564YR84_HYMDI|nr:unnamed protein product [Hymenolepis diminuta]
MIRIKLSLFSTPELRTLVSYGLLHVLFISSLPQHAALSLLSLSLCYSFQTRCGFLEYIFWSTQLLVFRFTIVVSSYSNSYELVAVIVVIR